MSAITAYRARFFRPLSKSGKCTGIGGVSDFAKTPATPCSSGQLDVDLYQFLETATFATDNRVNSITTIW